MNKLFATSAIFLSLLATLPAWGQTTVIRRGQSEAERKQSEERLQRQREEKDRQAAEKRAEEERNVHEAYLKVAARQKSISDSLERVKQAKAQAAAERDVTLELKTRGEVAIEIGSEKNYYYDTFIGDDMRFQIMDHEVYLYSGNSKGKVIIPAHVTYPVNNGKSKRTLNVTKIRASAFSKNKNVVSVVIPNTVKEIGGCAFKGCENLEEVNISQSVTAIGGGAFSDCKKLKSITIDEGNDNFVFEDGILYDRDKTRIISALPSVVQGNAIIEKSVSIVDAHAFAGCTALSSVKFPQNLSKIEASAFERSGLVSLDIPNSVRHIGGEAFLDCKNLATVALNEGLQEIGYCAFQGTIIRSIKLPNTLKEIEVGSFKNCLNLKEIVIPANGAKIGWGAFENCKELLKVVVSGDNCEIGWKAFMDCRKLSNIEIKGNTLVKDGAFEGCDNIKMVTETAADGKRKNVKLRKEWLK